MKLKSIIKVQLIININKKLDKINYNKNRSLNHFGHGLKKTNLKIIKKHNNIFEQCP